LFLADQVPCRLLAVLRNLLVAGAPIDKAPHLVGVAASAYCLADRVGQRWAVFLQGAPRFAV